MAKRVLVPLDTTVGAEAVLDLIADLARGGGATVRLLHVAPSPQNVVGADGRVIAYVDQEVDRLEAEGRDYLQTVVARLDGLPVEPVVRFGDPVTEILAESEAFGADLIAFTANCRRGLGRLVLGGTADQVCRRTALPVMVLRGGAAA